MVDVDRDVLRVGRGDAWTVDRDPPPRDRTVDPRAPRRIALTARQVERSAAAIIAGTQHDISGEDVRAAIEMCEAAIRSARTGHAQSNPSEVA